MRSDTTSRCDFVEKSTLRPDLIVPCDNLRSADTPIDDRTTTKLSYAKPGPVELVQSFKPVIQYKRYITHCPLLASQHYVLRHDHSWN